jgi:hypothetical protein
MKLHMSKVASCCFHHIRRLHQTNRLVGREVTTQMPVSLILSRHDYCNSLPPELSLASLEHSQRVQNAAARLILNLRPRHHITTALKQLQWLPYSRIPCHVQKMLVDVSGHAPQYLRFSVTVLQQFLCCQTQKRTRI